MPSSTEEAGTKGHGDEQGLPQGEKQPYSCFSSTTGDFRLVE
jgi:hypothetical protein